MPKILDLKTQNMIYYCANMIPCAASNYIFREMYRILKPGGKLIIFEPHVSLIYQLVTFFTKHEGFDFTVDIWNKISQSNKITIHGTLIKQLHIFCSRTMNCFIKI